MAELVIADLQRIARAAAERYLLPPELVCAVIEQESAWKPGATRYEPDFAAKYGPVYRRLFPDCPHLEDPLFYSSLGLMQVMGGVAWEHMFRKELPLLYDPETNCDVGCRVLATKLRRVGWAAGEPLTEVLAVKGLLRWNGGGRKAYAKEVLARIPRYREAA